MGIPRAQLNDRIKSRMYPPDKKKLGRDGMTQADHVAVNVTRTERHIHNQFTSFLRRRDLEFTHSNPVRSASIESGTPDYRIARNNRQLFIEFKVPPNKLDPAQIEYLAKCERNGNIVAVIEETAPGVAYTAAIRLVTEYFKLTDIEEFL